MHQTLIETLLAFFDHHKDWQEKVENEMSKLRDAVTALQTSVADLKTRSANKEAALQADLDAADQEAAAVADQLAAITSDIDTVDVVAPPSLS